MKTVSVCLIAAASIATLLIGAPPASAQDTGLYGTVNVGSTSVEPTYGVAPKGVILDVRLGDVFFVYDGWSIAGEVGVSNSNAFARERGTFCIDPSCIDSGKWTDTTTTKWSGSLGVAISRSIGPIIATVNGGVRVSDFTQKSSYDYQGHGVNEVYQDTQFALGGYYGARIDYPVTDRLSLGLGWEHSDLVDTKWSSTYGSGQRGFTQDTWSLGAKWKFGPTN